MDEEERTERTEDMDDSPDKYWKEFVRTGKVKDYLRYAMGLRDE